MKASQLIQQYLHETEDPVDKMHHCKSCGASFPASQIVKVDKKEYCPSCHSTSIELDPNLYPKQPKGEGTSGFTAYYCSDCGTSFYQNQITNGKYCPNCASGNISVDPNPYGTGEFYQEGYEGFKKLSKEVGSPALAAWIGRKKYGKAKFQKMAQAGKGV